MFSGIFSAASNVLWGRTTEGEEITPQPQNQTASRPPRRHGRYQYLFNPPLNAENAEESSEDSSTDDTEYSPTVEDVLDVKQIFVERDIPLELIDSIIDFAEYWPHTSSFIRSYPDKDIIIRGQSGHEDQLLLRTPPVGYIPLQAWESNVTPSKKTITDVGPELEGTGKYRWSLPTVPQLSIPEGLKDDAATQKVLKHWESSSSARGMPCRKVVFTIKSCDQGWGGNSSDRGTYKGSWTWFDVGLERMIAYRDGKYTDTTMIQNLLTVPGITENDEEDPISSSNSDFPIVCSTVHVLPADNIETTTTPQGVEVKELKHELSPQSMCLQKNRTATRDITKHVITWSPHDNIDPESSEAAELEGQGRGKASMNGEFMRNLKIGDSITVWGKARFGGWSNFVKEVKVDVYWAV
ncbi:hypothetical protein HYFRA_00011619 [Hymenoscyphus fraxineus]|uniref:Ankyrin repeat protein n=1 Tax=Hymenoscyphus fraxineus TaxID=746836 RepID=A0A9N9L052_9HELO|nr:hypothetical protein HYFRA_00011619 [Hymenoscyphus fraxineus]